VWSALGCGIIIAGGVASVAFDHDIYQSFIACLIFVISCGITLGIIARLVAERENIPLRNFFKWSALGWGILFTGSIAYAFSEDIPRSTIAFLIFVISGGFAVGIAARLVAEIADAIREYRKSL
jgi:hypothetical protein